ncbi:hypothetical protein CPC08DRAFT_768680 [Agrocybe pediades]|nr:hypothetical protein CPC08DRAFT_768680 [Agrocybe pediades]
MDESPVIPDHVAKITGPLLLGYLFTFGLFGVLAMQVYIYYLAFRKEPIVNRILVYTVFLIMVVQTVLLSQTAFDTFGRGFGQIDTVDNISHIWFSVPILGSIVALGTQLYFAFRISVMAKDKQLALVVASLSLIQLAGGIFTGVVGHDTSRFSAFQNSKVGLASIGLWNGAGALCDILIATCMVHFYVNPKSPWKLKQSRVPVFFRLPVQSGVILTAVAITNTALCLLPGRQTYFQTTSSILGNTYANTLLALLNSRVRLGRPTGYVDDEVSETTFETQQEHPRSALVFAQPDETILDNVGITTERRPSTQTEAGRPSWSGSHRNAAGMRTHPRPMSSTSEDSRTLGSMNLMSIDDWERRHSGRPQTPLRQQEEDEEKHIGHAV